MAIGVFAFIFSGRYSRVTSAGSGTTGGELFPRIAACGLFFASLFVFIQEIINRKTQTDDAEESIAWNKFLITILILTAYYLLLKPLGFIVASMLVVCIVMYCLGCRKYWVMILYSFLLSTIIFAIFYYGMYVSLPLGILSSVIPKY